jgi:hypothetical protein
LLKKGAYKMKKQSLLVTVLVLVALLAMTTPVFAAEKGPTGEKIRLYFGDTVLPAGAPFYIEHGWVQTSEDGAIGVFDFKLEVDGVLLQEDFKMFSAVSGDPDVLWRLWRYNFPDGMTGMHTFTGHWIAPCQYAVDWLEYPGPCVTPNAKVETSSRSVTVTFVP